MRDPLEGLDRDGLIITGASIDRVSDRFRPVIDATIASVLDRAPTASVYLYGSVATGQARAPQSDVDLLTIGLDGVAAEQIGADLTARFRDRCRAVEIAPASETDFLGPSDEAYGGRVFLHHYCVHLQGADLDLATTGFPGDRRAARGFNGDLGRHHARWRELSGSVDPADLGRRIGRKTLLAVAGLVSVHDATWTTDRAHAARRWSERHPGLRSGLDELLAWSDGAAADQSAVDRVIGGVVDAVVEQFADEIGLWPSPTT